MHKTQLINNLPSIFPVRDFVQDLFVFCSYFSAAYKDIIFASPDEKNVFLSPGGTPYPMS